MNEYHVPSSLGETLNLLKKYEGKARIISGGTDLILQLEEGKHKVDALVDISELTEYKQIKEEKGFLKLGALCTHAQIAASSLVQKIAPALAEASRSVGSPQIRNIGTLGGNIVNAQPAADASIALTALDARVAVVSQTENKGIPIGQLFSGVGKSTLDPSCEILLEVLIPVKKGKATSSFSRLSKRKSLSLPVLNNAVSVVLNSDLSIFQEVRIAVGPVATVPWRAEDAESYLQGAVVSSNAVKEASLLAAEKAAPRESLRGSAVYRKEMVSVLVYRSIEAALKRLGRELNG